MIKKNFKNKNISKKTKIGTKQHNRQNVNICIRNLNTNTDRKQMNIFERKVYRIILGPVYDKKKTGGY
jgi:hypothetical protein